MKNTLILMLGFGLLTANSAYALATIDLKDTGSRYTNNGRILADQTLSGNGVVRNTAGSTIIKANALKVNVKLKNVNVTNNGDVEAVQHVSGNGTATNAAAAGLIVE